MAASPEREAAIFMFTGILRLFRSQACGFIRALLLVLPLKLIDAARSIDQLLLAREKRVAAGADFNTDVGLVRGSGAKRVSARADHVHLIVCGVYSGFHGYTSGDFLGKLHITTVLISGRK
jgi:hypothetical protein